jgi:mutator family transposase
MQGQGLEWGEGYRSLGREAIAGILQGQMAQAIDDHLDRMAVLDEADRRNGSYRRHLLTELGAIELAVPRTRRFAPIGVVRAYARRPEQIDRMILACFVLGLSVRKVSEALLPILGRPISPATVSTVAKQLDAVVAAFHARPLKQQYRVLMLDGVVLARRTGAGAIRRPVLVALGLRHDGKKEIIDFRLAQSESAAEWERFLGDPPRPERRGARDDLRRRRRRTARRAANRLSGDRGATLLGTQDPQCSRQGAGCRPASRQGRSARHHEREHRAAGAFGSPSFRRPLGGRLSPGCRLPA